MPSWKRLPPLLMCLTVALLLTACKTATTENVKTGDGDYPQTNPNPSRFMNLHGTIKGALDIRFKIGWTASSGACQFYNAETKKTLPYSVILPLDIMRDGEEFSAQVAADGILPGRCGWKFSGISIWGGESSFGQILVHPDPPPLQPGQSPNNVANLLCKMRMRQLPPVEPVLLCRKAKQNQRGTLFWYPQTTGLEINIAEVECPGEWCD